MEELSTSVFQLLRQHDRTDTAATAILVRLLSTIQPLSSFICWIRVSGVAADMTD